MAETDRYDRMNSDQLNAEATARGLNLDEFQSLANNKERAQQLRDHDAARDADAQVAQQNADQVRQQQEQQAQAGQDQAQATDQAQANREAQQAQTGSGQPQNGPSSAPQSDQSLANAQAAAAGDLRTDEGIDTGQVEQIGGDSAFTDDNPEAR